MASTVNTMTPRDKLVEKIKDVGWELINRAEEMVGNDLDMVTHFEIRTSNLAGPDSIPTIEWTTEVLNKNTYNRLYKKEK